MTEGEAVKLILALAVCGVVGWCAWRVFCRLSAAVRPVRKVIDEHTEPTLDRMGLGRFVDANRRWNASVDATVDGSNAAAEKRGDKLQAKAEARRR